MFIELPNLTESYQKICCSPAVFASKITAGKFKIPKHIKFIDNEIMKMMNGKFSKLIINIPPRHGKSELLSKYLPAWYLCHFPDKKVIFTSYNAAFAKSWGQKVMEIINESGNSYNVDIDSKSRAVGEFRIAGKSGGMSSVGAGGTITGKGCDLLIIDDPIKNQSEANSIKIRDKVWDWFLSTAFTRLEPDGILIIIMTRWHEDDICGRIYKNFDDFDNNDWHKIIIPAIAENKDLLGRCEGEALWSKRFDISKLKDIKRTIGAYWFSALYQQRPTQKDGSIFFKKDFRYFEIINDCFVYNYNSDNKITRMTDCSIYASLDLAVSSKQTSDFTVAVVFAVSLKKEIFVVEIIRERFEGADHIDLLKNIYAKWKPTLIGIEKVQYQLTLIQQSLRIGLPVMELIPDSDKVSRSLPIAHRLRSGNVYFNSKAHWLVDFEDELLSFPNSRYDDQVDAFSYIARMIAPTSGTMPIGAINSSKSRKSILTGY